jgi:hypothetical protein
MGIEYAYNGYTDSLRSDAFGVRKKVWGLNAVYGMQRAIGKRWALDFYAVWLSYLVFGKGQHVIIGIGDGKFGGAIEGLLETMDNVNFVMDGFEERPNVGNPDIEQQGAAVRAADLRQGIVEALKRLEHEGDVAAGDHGPD